MNFQKYTNKLQNIIQEAQTLAVSLNIQVLVQPIYWRLF